MDTLEAFGWNATFLQAWQAIAEPGLVPARVVADFGTSLRVVTPAPVAAELSGKLAHYTSRLLTPKVGDWVGIHLASDGSAVIESVIPRYNEIARKVAGQRVVKQIIAANVDVAFVLLALDNDFSVERLQRFLYQLSVSHITPVIVLNKADKVDDLTPYLDSLQSLEHPLVITTAAAGRGVDDMLSYIKPGETAMLLGSSGVGKSTLTNQLLGRNEQATNAVRASDDSGQHTTVHRELFVLPGGGLLIDTPGIRELQLWGTNNDLDENFDDVTELASHCQYRNCQHRNEAGCAVQAALQTGALPASHYANYGKMRAELSVLHDKRVVNARRANQRSQKSRQQPAVDSFDDDS